MEAEYDRLIDYVIQGAIKEASPKTAAAAIDGGFLAQFLEWLSAHQDEILAIVKLIITIMALF